MALFLNSAWALLAMVIVLHWLRRRGHTHADCHSQFIAMVMLIVILFPVISVSDDLWSAQNPAETDSCLRRDHRASCLHSIFPSFAALPESAPAELRFAYYRLAAPLPRVVPVVENPALDPIQNRPPPVA
jgi:hypothetical protein